MRLPATWVLYAGDDGAAAEAEIRARVNELIARVEAMPRPVAATALVSEFRAEVEPLLERHAGLGADEEEQRQLMAGVFRDLAGRSGADEATVYDAVLYGETDAEFDAWVQGTSVARALRRQERRGKLETGGANRARPPSHRHRRRAPVCAKSLPEQCARNDGHLGECQCPHRALADMLRAGLENLAFEARQHDVFPLRKAVRRAQDLLQRTALDRAEFRREREERLARRNRKRAEQDARPFTREMLLANLKAALPRMEDLLAQVSGHWGYEDRLYRLYHHSYKVFWLDLDTQKIVEALGSLAPGRELNEDFLVIVNNGTFRSFQWADNQRWLDATRPLAEAFFHARFFLEMAVRYGRALEHPPKTLPSGWAALLYLYDLR